MQRLKKLMAMVLAVCMLIGIPMSVDVAAVGKPDATDLTITQALVIPDSWGVDPSIVAPNKGILLYFTGGNITVGYRPSLYYNIAVTICNQDNWAYGDVNGSPLMWNCDMIVNNAVSTAPNNFISRLNSSMDLSLLPNNLTAAQKAKYTSPIDTLDEIAMLAKDLGGKVQYRLFEQGSTCTANGLVENCYDSSNNNVKLTGQIKVNANGVYNGGNDAYDCAIADMVFVGDNATELLKAEFVESENAIKLTASEALNYSTRGNNYTKAGLAVINSKGQIMTVNGSTYKTQKEVADGALTGYTDLYYDGGMTFEQVLYNGGGYSINKCFLNPTQLAKYRELVSHAAALQAADPNGGYQISYIVADIVAKLVAKRGESNGNHFVDAVWGASSHPLYANYSNPSLGVVDMAALPIVSVKSDTNNSEPLTVKGVFINPKADSEVVITFSEPIKYSGTPDIRIYPVDANNDSTIDKNYDAKSYWWVKVNGYYGNSTNQLVGTLSTPGSQKTPVNQRYTDIVNFCNNSHAGKPIKLAIWDQSWVKIPTNGLVDTITSADGTKHLQANKTADRDVALVSITQETISVEKIRVLSDRALEITWTDGVTEGIYRNDSKAYTAIRITNDNLDMQKKTDGSWHQYGGTMMPTADPAVWHFNLNYGHSFTNIINQVKPGATYAGQKITFAIENDPTGAKDLTNQVDNYTSVDGVRPVTATNDATQAGWRDGSYTVVSFVPTPYAALAVNDSQVRVYLENAGTLGAGNVTIGGVAATAITKESDTCYLVTFPAGTVTDTSSVNVPAGLLCDALGQTNAGVTLNCTVAFAKANDTVTLGNGTFSFMNADTGREIAVGTTTEFTPNALGNNVYTFTANGKYLDLTGVTAALSDHEVRYQVKSAANERFVLYVKDGLAVRDTDANTDGNPTLGLTDINQISMGWYLTKTGQTKPLRILPIGDSITFGTNPDAPWPLMGWRDDLTKLLTNKLDRFVFVGNQTTYVTTVDSDILTRHDGNPGWTVKDHGGRNGIYDLVPGIVNKYDPDVVLMMIGINDMAVYSSGGFTTAERDEMKANYRDLVVALSADMDETDTIFCSRLTPMSSKHSLYSANMPETFNDTWGFNSWVAEWAAEGLPVVLNDNYAALAGKTGVVCSDGIHLSVDGDPYVAQRYATSLMSVYNANGDKFDPNSSLQIMLNLAGNGDTVTLQADYDMTDKAVSCIPAGVTLDLNGHTVTAKNLVSFGQIIDSSEGQGGLIIDGTGKTGVTLLQENNTAMPLYDKTFGGYRFFSVTVTNKTPQSGENFVKFGINLKFGHTDAYRLLLDAANANVKLMADLAVNNSTLTYTFGSSHLATYAAAVLEDLSTETTSVLTLKIGGFDELTEPTTITLTPKLKSNTYVFRDGAALTATPIYNKPVSISNICGNYSLSQYGGQTRDLISSDLTCYSLTITEDQMISSCVSYSTFDNFYIQCASNYEGMTKDEVFTQLSEEGQIFTLDSENYVPRVGDHIEYDILSISDTAIVYTDHTATYTLTIQCNPDTNSLLLQSTDQPNGYGSLCIGGRYNKITIDQLYGVYDAYIPVEEYTSAISNRPVNLLHDFFSLSNNPMQCFSGAFECRLQNDPGVTPDFVYQNNAYTHGSGGDALMLDPIITNNKLTFTDRGNTYTVSFSYDWINETITILDSDYSGSYETAYKFTEGLTYTKQ